MRRIVQIATATRARYTQSTVALCDDGSVWECLWDDDDEQWSDWYPLPSIPSPTSPEET